MLVLVTGFKGFIGSHIVKELNARKIDYAPFSGDCLNKEDWSHNFNSRMTHVLHCAGYNGGIQFNCKFPADIFYKNTIMALNGMQACCDNKVQYFMSFVTSCGYPTDERISELDNMPYGEYEYLQGKPHETVQAHGYAKRNIMLGCKFYHAQNGLYPVCFCPNTVFGPRDRIDHREKVMMALIRKFAYAKMYKEPSVSLLGTGQVQREFTYVKHVAQIVAEWIQHPISYSGNGEPINIGPSFEMSIYDLAYKIARKVRYTGDILWDVNRPDGAERKALSYKKQEFYELSPYKRYSPDEAIEETIKWYIEDCLHGNYESISQGLMYGFK